LRSPVAHRMMRDFAFVAAHRLVERQPQVKFWFGVHHEHINPVARAFVNAKIVFSSSGRMLFSHIQKLHERRSHHGYRTNGVRMVVLLGMRVPAPTSTGASKSVRDYGGLVSRPEELHPELTHQNPKHSPLLDAVHLHFRTLPSFLIEAVIACRGLGEPTDSSAVVLVGRRTWRTGTCDAHPARRMAPRPAVHVVFERQIALALWFCGA
jgi:hypothetical protein